MLGDARRQLRVVERRWEKKKKTYHNSRKYSLWDSKSTVERMELRQYGADKQLGEARAKCAHLRDLLARFRSAHLWTKRFFANPGDEATLFFYERSQRRMLERPPVPHWTSMWPGHGHNMWDKIVQDFGLGATWGLLHADELQPSQDDMPTGCPQERAKAHSEEHLRSCIRARMKAEEEDPSLCMSRRCMLDWAISSVDAREIIREFGVCMCPMPLSWDDCELCASC